TCSYNANIIECFFKFFFFFQAEDGIRDFHVTGVQTCALPISARGRREIRELNDRSDRLAARLLGAVSPKQRERLVAAMAEVHREIGRASCRGKGGDIGGRRRMRRKKSRKGEGRVG